MMRQAFSFLVFALFLAACSTTKKVAPLQTAIAKKDTAQTVVVKAIPAVDSAAIVRDIMTKVM
ncbi:hypothetical protein ABTM87_19440, partial [Acinetobacter baumannii]